MCTADLLFVSYLDYLALTTQTEEVLTKQRAFSAVIDYSKTKTHVPQILQYHVTDSWIVCKAVFYPKTDNTVQTQISICCSPLCLSRLSSVLSQTLSSSLVFVWQELRGLERAPEDSVYCKEHPWDMIPFQVRVTSSPHSKEVYHYCPLVLPL